MPKVKDKTGKIVDVREGELSSAIEGGASYVPGEIYTVVNKEDPDAGPVQIDGEDMRMALQTDYRLFDQVDANASFQDALERDRYEDPESQLGAFLGGALSGATLGASDALLRGVESDEERQVTQERRKRNPIAAAAGEVAGSIVTGGGGVATRAGAKLTSKLGGKAAAKVLGTGTEGAIMGAGSELSNLALSDKEMSAEEVATSLMKGAGTGFAMGAGLQAIGSGLSKGAKALKKRTNLNRIVSKEGQKLTVAARATSQSIDDIGKAAAKELDAGVINKLDADSLAHRIQAMEETGSKLVKQDMTSVLGKSDFTRRAVQFEKALAKVKKIKAEPKNYEKLARALDDLETHTTNLANITGNGGQVRGALNSLPKAFRQTAPREVAPEVIALAKKAKPLNAKELDNFSKLDTTAAFKAAKQIDDQYNALEQMAKATERDLSPQFSALKRSVDEFTGSTDSARNFFDRLGAKQAVTQLDEMGTAGQTLMKLWVAENPNRLANALQKSGAFAQGAAEAAGSLTGLGSIMGGGGLAGAIGSKIGFNIVGKLSDMATKSSDRLVGSISRLMGAAGTQVPKATKIVTHPALDAFNHYSGTKHKDIKAAYKDTVTSIDEASTANFKSAIEPLALASPEVAQLAEERVNRATKFLKSKVPVDIFGRTIEEFDVAPEEAIRMGRYMQGVNNPDQVIEDVVNGRGNPDSIEAMKAVYPRKFAVVQQEIMSHADKFRSLPHDRRTQISLYFDIPIDPTFHPSLLAISQNFEQAREQEQAQDRTGVQIGRPSLAPTKLDQAST